MGAPNNCTSPAVARRWPATTSASSRWPLPSTPATPRISPWCRTSETFSMPEERPSPPAETPTSSSSTSPLTCEAWRRSTRRALELGDGGARARLVTEHDAHDLGLQLLGRARAQVVLGQAAGHAALLEDRDAVADRGRLVQLVRDEDERHSRLLQPDQDLLELRDALRREHRGRLVQDQHARAAPQRLDDLDLLLLTEREVARARARVDLDAERAGELGQPGRARLGVEAHAAALAEQQVLEHAERRHERRVLVDHAHAEPERSARRVDAHVLAAHADVAGVGLRHAREHAHQRRLARAVLAQQAVHLAGADREVDVVVRDDAREGLRDADQLDGGGACPRRRVDVVPNGRQEKTDSATSSAP